MANAEVDRRRSPLAHLADQLSAATVTGPRAVRLRERPFRTMVNVRVPPGSAAASRIADLLGVPLPDRCGTTSSTSSASSAARHTALWLGPDEWLVESETPAEPLTAELLTALAGDAGSVVDVSANRTTLELSGRSAPLVLRKDCAIDLHPRVFGPGCAVSTSVGLVPAIVWQVDDRPTYRLLPRASFADYLARRLMDAMAEYAVESIPDQRFDLSPEPSPGTDVKDMRSG